MNDSQILSNCPFCGGKAETWDGVGPWHVVCTKCGTVGSPCLTEAEAIAAWNSRAERTCRIAEYDEAPFPVCSECGAVQPDDYTVYFCWNCGAKVRDE